MILPLVMAKQTHNLTLSVVRKTFYELTKHSHCANIYSVQEVAKSVVLDRGSIPLTSIDGGAMVSTGQKGCNC